MAKPTSDRRWAFDTLAIHAGQAPDPQSGAVMPPIVLASTFAHERLGAHRGFEYGRTGNPTRNTLEACLAALEGGSEALAFGSGCAAITALLQTLRPGDHVVACDDVYGGTFRLLDKVFGPLGVVTSWVDMTDLDNVRAALRDDTALVWIETPTNPMLRIIDIAAVAKISHAAGALVGVDNTFATPALQRPLKLGADVVAHSMTKYLNGHSDVIGGALITSDEPLAERLRFIQNAAGAVLSPFDSFLVLRGLKTLPLRMERHCASAASLAAWLEGRPEVERVFYPGLPSNPQRALAARQMTAFGGMISAVIRGGLPAVEAFLGSVELFTLAESLGGVESLIEHPATMTHGSVPRAQREAVGVVDGLVRISVGLEREADLRADLVRALEATALA